MCVGGVGMGVVVVGGLKHSSQDYRREEWAGVVMGSRPAANGWWLEGRGGSDGGSTGLPQECWQLLCCSEVTSIRRNKNTHKSLTPLMPPLPRFWGQLSLTLSRVK